MPISHVLLAVLVVAIWGSNFVIIDIGLRHFPPFTFAALRFLLVSLPLLPFVPRPRVGTGTLAGYGFAIGVGQFGLMLYALNGHIAPGLASLLIQTQAFFTVGLSMLLNGERVRRGNLAALALCATGITLIGVGTSDGTDALGVLLVLGAAIGWAIGNLIAKRAGAIDVLGLVVWSGLLASIPLLAAALLREGPAVIGASITEAGVAAWAVVLWQSYANALFGYSVWNWLLARHSAAAVAPLGLLVPLFGMSAAAGFLAEPMPTRKLVAAALVLTGLAVNLVTAPRRATFCKRRKLP